MKHGNAVGLDYHSEFVQVAVIDARGRLLGNRKCPNDWQAIRSMAGAYGPVGRAAIEACCGAADLAEQLSNWSRRRAGMWSWRTRVTWRG